MNRIFVLLFSLSSLFCFSQKDTVSIFNALQNNNSNNSHVLVSQSPSIRLLIERDVSINGGIRGVKDGYRIQIFSGYGHDARKKSQILSIELYFRYHFFNNCMLLLFF